MSIRKEITAIVERNCPGKANAVLIDELVYYTAKFAGELVVGVTDSIQQMAAFDARDDVAARGRIGP